MQIVQIRSADGHGGMGIMHLNFGAFLIYAGMEHPTVRNKLLSGGQMEGDANAVAVKVVRIGF